MEWFGRLVRDIASLRVQGAEAIARAGVRGVARLSREGGDVVAGARRLLAARPTEPMLQNAVAYLLAHRAITPLPVLARRLLILFDEARERIAESAAGLVRSRKVYATHCHSSTVVAAFLLAEREGKEFLVRNTETRPLFQGRKTARELSARGVPVEHHVDSCFLLALEGCAGVFLGADAILSEGSVVNKVGSGVIARLAAERGVPVYVLASSWKYAGKDPASFRDELEERSPSEVWPGAPRGVMVRNPAFELVERRFITALVTELGIHDPPSAARLIRDRRKKGLLDEKTEKRGY